MNDTPQEFEKSKNLNMNKLELEEIFNFMDVVRDTGNHFEETNDKAGIQLTIKLMKILAARVDNISEGLRKK